MNKRQKEVQQVYLDNEKETLERLKKNYGDALGRINEKLEQLTARQDARMQYVIYQIEYQKALKEQIETILTDLQAEEFETISEYLTRSYEDGFIGTMYDLQGQGIPLVLPIDQEQVVSAVQLESRISENLYTRLGRDVGKLQIVISEEISRGISTNRMYGEMARSISEYGNIPMNNAMRIARTEAHRIQNRAAEHALFKAKDKGADVVKQWDSTLDDRTRESHMQLDGQIRELDKPFEVNGKKAMYPGGFGDPSEDCNCRCCMLQRAKWALGNDYTKWSEDAPVMVSDDGTTQFVKISEKDYGSFKKIYKGLAAVIGGNGIPEHEEPVLLRVIENVSQKDIMKEITAYEKAAVAESIETACVITTEGRVYKCFGVKDRVFPDFDLKDELYGATISHNHPADVTEYTFSGDDLSLFLEYDLEVLRGCDEKYTYEFTRDVSRRDKQPEEWKSEEEFYHSLMIQEAMNYNIGYRRWENDQGAGESGSG